MKFDDVSGMVTLLCLISLDKSLAPSLKLLATTAIDAVIERSGSAQIVSYPIHHHNPWLRSVQERLVCTSLLKLASDMPTLNKAALVVALGNGSPTIRRISRWLSTALIVEGIVIPKVSSFLHQRWRSTLMVSNQDLNAVISASKIRAYLESPQAGLMDVQGSEEIDFENVTNKVTLLSVALTDITRQVERGTGAGANDLNAVSVQLANLHAKIGEDSFHI